MQVLKESVKKAILNGAILEFFEHGYQSANMRRIADSANITVGNIYRYFENKEALFNAVLSPAKRAIDDLESFDKKLQALPDRPARATRPTRWIKTLLVGGNP